MLLAFIVEKKKGTRSPKPRRNLGLAAVLKTEVLFGGRLEQVISNIGILGVAILLHADKGIALGGPTDNLEASMG